MHERLCTHAESVAFFGGGAREKAVSIKHIYFSLAYPLYIMIMAGPPYFL